MLSKHYRQVTILFNKKYLHTSTGTGVAGHPNLIKAGIQG